MVWFGLWMACAPEAPPVPPPGTITDHGPRVLSVNGMEVGEKEIALVLDAMQIPLPEREAFVKTKRGVHVIEEYALATSLYQRAVEEKLHEDPVIQLQLAVAERQVLARIMRSRLAAQSVTDEAVKAWYEKNKVHFQRPEAVARHLLVGEEILAKDLLARLQAGEKFEDLVKAHSIDEATKGKGGDLGWFKLDDPIYGAAATTATYGVPTVFESRMGWHILEVRERREVTPLEAVRPFIEDTLRKEADPVELDKLRVAMKLDWVEPPPPDDGQPDLPAGHPPPGTPMTDAHGDPLVPGH